MHLYYTSETEGNPTITFNKHALEMARTMIALDKTVQKIRFKDYNEICA